MPTTDPRISAHEPVHDVDVVRAFLQEEPGGVFALGMPVAEIGVAAVVHEMTTPARLNLADQSRVDDLLHFEDDREVPHVVPKV